MTLPLGYELLTHFAPRSRFPGAVLASCTFAHASELGGVRKDEVLKVLIDRKENAGRATASSNEKALAPRGALDDL